MGTVLEDVLHGEEVEGLSYNAFGFTVKVGEKTIGNLTLEEAEKILSIPLPIATVVEEKGEAGEAQMRQA